MADSLDCTILPVSVFAAVFMWIIRDEPDMPWRILMFMWCVVAILLAIKGVV